MVDNVSYEENVVQLLAAYNDRDIDDHSIRIILELTFSGRMSELRRVNVADAHNFIKTRCPFLRKKNFVCILQF